VDNKLVRELEVREEASELLQVLPACVCPLAAQSSAPTFHSDHERNNRGSLLLESDMPAHGELVAMCPAPTVRHLSIYSASRRGTHHAVWCPAEVEACMRRSRHVPPPGWGYST
jgi:hypothetical protein